MFKATKRAFQAYSERKQADKEIFKEKSNFATLEIFKLLLNNLITQDINTNYYVKKLFKITENDFYLKSAPEIVPTHCQKKKCNIKN